MRVMFVEASSGGVVGGSLTGLYHLIRGLVATGVTCSIALYEPKTIEGDLLAHGVEVYHLARRRLPKQHGLLQLDSYQKAKRVGAVARTFALGRRAIRLVLEELPAAITLAQTIRQDRPDVVHLGNGVRANFDGLLATRLTRVPVVCHIKGFEKYSARERRAARHVDAAVCMTRAVHAHCLENGVAARRTRVIYDAVDEAGFRPSRARADVRAELGLPAASPCFGIAGNIQEWKGQAVVVDAMAQLHRRLPSAHCVIIGGAHRAGADYETALRDRVRTLGLGDVIHFTGFRRDIADVMNALDVVVHASIRPEPFGRVILEGMLLAKPVVAAAAGGVPELVSDGETGFLVPPGQPAILADRLVGLLSDAARRERIGARAQTWARTHFSLAQQVSAMNDVYRSVRLVA